MAVSKKPGGQVKSLTVSRRGDKFTAKWKVPSGDVKGGTSDQATSMRVWAKRNIVGKKDTDIFEDKSISTSHTSKFCELKRSSWYPYTSKRLEGVTFYVQERNAKGGGKVAKRRFAIEPPTAPTVGAIAVSNGNVSCKITVPDCKGTSKERDRVRVVVKRSTNRSAEIAAGKTVKTETLHDDYHLKSEAKGEYTWSRDETAWADFASIDEYIKYEVTAYAQGYRGQVSKSVSKVLSFADTPVIQGVDVDGDFVRVRFTAHPDSKNKRGVTTTQLYVGYSESETVTTWTKIDGATDDGECTALSCSRGLITPSVGEHVYFRIQATYLNEATSQFSNQVEAVELYVKPADGSEAAADEISIVQLAPCEDGKSIIATAAWADGDGYTGTEYSYSDDQDAWRSTSNPKTFKTEDVSWDDGAYGAFPHSTSLKVSGLSEATQYHFRARRYDVSDDTRHGGWSSMASAKTGASAQGVTASLPMRSVRGRPVLVSWAVGGDVPQTAWQVIANGSMVAAGDGTASSCELPARCTDRDALTVSVWAMVNGVWLRSEEAVCTMVELPTSTVTCNRIVTASGHPVHVEASEAGASVHLSLYSCGVTDQLPDGERIQRDGDLVWSADCIAPADLAINGELIDGAAYRLCSVATVEGIEGDQVWASWTDGEGEAVDRMEVAWSHQAVAPECHVSATSDNLTATVRIVAPAEAADTDEWRVYRMDDDRCRLVAYGAYPAAGEDGTRPDVLVRDEYAPYAHEGACRYRVATITADGDCDWASGEYTMRGSSVRFDWPGGSVSLPWDIAIERKVEKSFEEVEYLDGTVGGGWSGASKRKVSVSASMFRGDDMTAVSALARYAGAVFVRTPDGQAFAANVAVDSVSLSADSRIMGCSLSAAEVDTDEYAIGSDDVSEAV